MNGQLAANSVKTYRLGPESLREVERNSRWLQALMLLVVVAISFFTQFKGGVPDWVHGEVSSVWLPLLTTTILCGVLYFSMQRGMRKQQEIWRSFELQVGEDFVLRRMINLKEIEIHRDEVAAICRTPTGLMIRSKEKGVSISVPKTLLEFEEVCGRLNAWRPIEEAPATFFAKNRQAAVLMIVVLELVLLMVFLFSRQSRWLVLSGLPLFVGLVGCSILLLKSKQLTAERKRFLWALVIPILSIGFRVAGAILHWK
jgi:hypothetical protein